MAHPAVALRRAGPSVVGRDFSTLIGAAISPEAAGRCRSRDALKWGGKAFRAAHLCTIVKQAVKPLSQNGVTA